MPNLPLNFRMKSPIRGGAASIQDTAKKGGPQNRREEYSAGAMGEKNVRTPSISHIFLISNSILTNRAYPIIVMIR